MANSENRLEIISRQEARRRGLMHYFSGRLCRWEHMSPRYVSDCSCVECAVARALFKQQTDPEYARARDKRYREAHPGQAKPRIARYLAKPGKREMKLAATARWVEANPDYHRNYGRTYKAIRLKTDLEFKLREYLRSRLRIAVKQNNRAGSAVRDLGCSIAEFKVHIEGLFKPGMTWENWGVGSGCWNLDHIRELATIDMQARAQFLQVAHYTNYQPLWSEENNAKRVLPAGRRRRAA